MIVGPFSPFNSVRQIKEFNESIEKLDDFLMSVEVHLMTCNIPLEKNEYVGGDADEDWTFIFVMRYRENAANFKLDYNYGTRFCTLLGESAAREWWINRQNADWSKSNYWRVVIAEDDKPPEVVEVSFRDIIMSHFSNSLDRELIMMELDQLHWNPAIEYLNSLRTRITSPFNRAYIQEWAMH